MKSSGWQNRFRRVARSTRTALYAQPQASKPNFVSILMDNLGYGEVGAYGGGVTRGTPTSRIDQLANEGMPMTNFNVEVRQRSEAMLSTKKTDRRLQIKGMAPHHGFEPRFTLVRSRR